MSKSRIPIEWDLGADPRYKRQNMERAMKGRIERGLVELITNSDDSYRDLEEAGKQVSGKIRIEIERKKKGQRSLVIVRDRAGGMNREEMYEKLGILGRRTSGFEKGKARRGLHRRGAKDVVAFGTVHFESIKDGEYNHLVIPPSLKCRFKNPRPQKVTQEIRERLGIPRGNGTVVTIEVESRFPIPRHETLVKDFSRYYSLRDIFSNPSREAIIVDINKNRENRLVYNPPVGEIVFDEEITIPNYPEAKAYLIIRKHVTPFEQALLPYREGILIKSTSAIHDCTYFGLESEPLAWRFTGELRCEFIDKLVREYDDREEANPDNPKHPDDNPMRLLDPFRDGLMWEHPFTQALYKKCKEILQSFIDELKESEQISKKKVTNKELYKKLESLSKEISRVFERKVKDLEEEIPTEDVNYPQIKELAIGLHIIPPEEHPIIVNQPKTFSIIVKHHEPLDESLPINVISSHPDVKIRTSPVFLKKFFEDGKVGKTTFTVESSTVGAEAFIEAYYGNYNNLILVKVIEPPPPPDLTLGLSFEKPLYRLRVNKEKNLILWLKINDNLKDRFVAEVSSDHPEIAVKGGGRWELHPTDTPGVFVGKGKVIGRQLKARGTITARVEGFGQAYTRVVVEEREFRSGINIKTKPVEEDFGSVRYKWDKDNDPYLLLIGAKHPSIRRYLGKPTGGEYEGINSPLYHTVLAEVIAEALAFRILEMQFKREGGEMDYSLAEAYYHRDFSEFLEITHKHLVNPEAIESLSQSKL